MDIIHIDNDIIVCIKPARVLSTDEPGGLPELLRDALGDPKADIRTVHRLDRVVSGLMVLARSSAMASELSRQITEGSFKKAYVAVVHGLLDAPKGTFRDFLLRNKAERKTYIVQHMEKGVQEAILDYQKISEINDMTKVAIQLRTGRTHQIRAQFSGRGYPLVGDRKYSLLEDNCEIALWSHRLAFRHPRTGEEMEFIKEPPHTFPWHLF